MRIKRLCFELTQTCDQRCAHCYNVWNEGARQPRLEPRKPLETARFLALMERAIVDSGAEQVTLSGGEPLLHPDALQIVERVCALGPKVQLVTNGKHVTPEVACSLARAGLSSAQLTLLSADPARHDELKGADSFASTTRAALDLRDAGVGVQACFVATRQSCDGFEEVLELCLALDIRSLAYNRFAPAGRAADGFAELMPSVEQVEANLEAAERLGPSWQIRVATAMPIPPCLIRIERFKWVRFGFCSTGTASPNVVVDPHGDVRSCNLASHVMGNLLEKSWAAVLRDGHPRQLFRRLHPLCRGCIHEQTCRGGCRESALACYGCEEAADPFIAAALET
jgi:radical SAM protein with 4Fe4S-binding SPASM domain